MFGKVARGLGCAPGSPFRCLGPLSPPSAWPPRARSASDSWLHSYAIFLRSSGARLRAALGGRFWGDSRRRRVALVGSRGIAETSSRHSPRAKSVAYKAACGRPLSFSPLALHLCTPVRHQLGFRGGVRRARVRHRRASSPFPRCGSAPSRRRASLPRWDSGRCGSSSSVPALT